jgi:hypothetical protein
MLKALPDGIIAFRQLVPAKARCIARTGIFLFALALCHIPKPARKLL